MKTVKPLALSLLHRVVEYAGEFHLTVCGIVCIPLTAPFAPLSEIALWKDLTPVLGEGVLDEVLPKPRGEVLVTGSAHTPGAAPAVACDVRVCIGAVDKTLRVVGDRVWDRDGAMTSPAPFTEMPLRYTHAFGGAGFAPNPTGKGAASVEGPGGAVTPLPNVEDPHAMIRTGSDTPAPAGFGPIELAWPQRASRLGTFDDRWVHDDFPGVPRDIDWSAFNAAPPDQWIDARWRGDETFTLQNMHATRSVIEGRLPGLAVRLFVNRKTADGEVFEEVATALDTVHFFPGVERAALIFRGLVKVGEDDAADVLQLLGALERAGEPRTVEHYRAALALRVDPVKGAHVGMRDRDLMPDGLSSGIAELMSSEPDTSQDLLAANQDRRAEAELARNREMLAAQGVDPDQYLPRALPEPEPEPSFDELPEALERFETQAEAQIVEAEAKQAQAVADAKALCARNGVDYDAVMADAKGKAGGPPRFTAEAEMQRLRAMVDEVRAAGADPRVMEAQLADPTLREKLLQAEMAMLESYRENAHQGEAAPRLAEAPNARARRFVEDRRAAGQGLASWDFTGADLSGMDLSGMDLRNALMESVSLRGCLLTGCDLRGAVLARADLSHAALDGARFAGANLGNATLQNARATEGVDLTDATLHGTDFTGATLGPVTLGAARLIDVKLRGATIGALSARGATLLQCDLGGMSLRGADLSDATFIECALPGVDLTGATLDAAALVACDAAGAILRGASGDNLRVVGASSLAGADLRDARLPDATLRGVPLRGALLANARIDRSDLSECDLRGADLTRVAGREARFVRADLTGATLVSAQFIQGIFQKATITDADLTDANLFGSDMTRVRGRPKSVEGAHLGRVAVTHRAPNG